MQYLTDRMGRAERRDRQGLELVAANAFFTRATLARQTSDASVNRLIAGGLLTQVMRDGMRYLEITSKGREVVKHSWRVW
jgi:hypothetical protein